MTIEDLFKRSFVISIDDERYNWYKKVFNYFQLPLSEKVGEKVAGQTPFQNCKYNHTQCVKLAKERNYPFCFILEDDAFPCTMIKSDLKYYLDKIDRKDVDFLLLGYYTKYIKRYDSLNIYHKVYKCYGTQAYIVYKRFYDKFINNVDKMDFADEWFMNRDYFKNLKIQIKMTKQLFAQYNIKKSMNGYNSFTARYRTIMKNFLLRPKYHIV